MICMTPEGTIFYSESDTAYKLLIKDTIESYQKKYFKFV